MNGLENQSTTAPDAAIAELRSELGVLRMLIAVALVMLCGLTAGADYFFYRQNQAIKAQTTQLQMIIDEFPQAAANDFLKRLRDYAKVHPDFAPIATKYSGIFGQPQPGAPKK